MTNINNNLNDKTSDVKPKNDINDLNTSDDFEVMESKRPKLREYLEKLYPRLKKQVSENNPYPKYKLITNELLEAIKYYGYKIQKNIRDHKTLLTENDKESYYFNDDSEAKFEAKIEELLINENIVFSKDSYEKAIKVMRADYEFCPIREQIKGFKWDGVQRLNQEYLSPYFIDIDNWFGDCLRAFLVGSVGRTFDSKFQSPVWIIAGGQGLGKSHFTNMLVSPFGDMYRSEKSLNLENKDDLSVCCERLIIEIPEGAGTFKKDREVIKRHMTTAHFEIRSPYGKYNIQRPHLASYIATMNLSGFGILKDPTGNRRFIICELKDKTGINRAYSKEIDIIQLWAEAYHIYKDKKHSMNNNYEFLIDTDKRDRINSKYANNPIEYDYLDEILEYTNNDNDRIKLTEIVDKLKEKSGEKTSGNILKSIINDFLTEKYKIKESIGEITTNGKRSNVRHFRCVKFKNI